ncbi:hypothetical protein NQ317_009041 [Molorchus minor]|uniref:Uncharacterized protein n=1 Tax=Molorchus minor TaxID=1323400 RepID=A0ABQ9JCE6_9CUCU|nr:hypothetical protein NQ317_009041 [Molorchus minor]
MCNTRSLARGTSFTRPTMSGALKRPPDLILAYLEDLIELRPPVLHIEVYLLTHVYRCVAAGHAVGSEAATLAAKLPAGSASSVPSTALSPLTSREHDLTTRRADSAAIEKCLEAAGNIAEYSNTFDGNQEQRMLSASHSGEKRAKVAVERLRPKAGAARGAGGFVDARVFCVA